MHAQQTRERALLILVADAWLAEEQYAHVAEEQYKQLPRGIDVHGPAEAHAGQGRVCRPVACSCV